MEYALRFPTSDLNEHIDIETLRILPIYSTREHVINKIIYLWLTGNSSLCMYICLFIYLITL